MYHTHLGEIGQPSDFINVKALLNTYTIDYPFAFRCQDFVVTFTFRTVDSHTWGYSIEWVYKGQRYPAQEMYMNESEYALLLISAFCNNRLSFDLSANIRNNRLNRADILMDHGLENELLLHAQCIWFIVQIMNWIIQTRELDVYRFPIFHTQWYPRMNSFTRFAALQACRFIVATQFEKINHLPDTEIHLSQLWT
jgi:hypothetical protein